MDVPEPLRQPLLQADVAPLRCCLLSGGESRRMGRDKALLPHPEGGIWLERSLLLLAELGAPITLLSRHREHLAIAEQLGVITPLAEPPPWEGPLLALHRLMQRHPNERLLLCPVDMPALTREALHTLVAAAIDPFALHPAHDGQRLQPLLGIYPSSTQIREHLKAAIGGGERRLQTWIASQPCKPVLLNPQAIRNVNRPEEVQWATSSTGPCRATSPNTCQRDWLRRMEKRCRLDPEPPP